MDPFATLGVAPRFDLDLTQLERRHRELSRALHPDRYASAPVTERRMSLSRAIEVNEAYRALKDPVKRAESLLTSSGVKVGETNEPGPSNELLMEMMDAREELAEVVKAKDLGGVIKLGEAMRAREQGVIVALSAAFEADDAAGLARAVTLLGELRYTKRFLDEVTAFEEAFAS